MKTRRLSGKQSEKNLLGMFESVQKTSSKTIRTSWINPDHSFSSDSANLGSAVRNMILIAFFLLVGLGKGFSQATITSISLGAQASPIVYGSGDATTFPVEIYYTGSGTTNLTISWRAPSGVTFTSPNPITLDPASSPALVDITLTTTVTSPAVLLTFKVKSGAISSNNSTFTIDKAPLTVTADNRSKCFGTALTLGTTAFTYGTTLNSETVDAVTLTSTGNYDAIGGAAGSYTGDIVPSAATGSNGFAATNYDITYSNGNMTVNVSTSSSTTASACDSYTWTENSGATYTTTGAYDQTYTNAAGCDSVHTLNLTVQYSNTGSTTASACDSYTWTENSGATYTTTGAYDQTYTNVAGCDSLHTLNLTVNYSSSSTTYATVCDSYVWASPLGDGATYTSSNTTATHTSTNAAGCVHTETLDLIVNYSSSSTTSATACNLYVWASYLGDGAAYTSSNTTATHTSTNAAGCVHTQTLDLTVNYSNTGSTTASACDSYTWTENSGETYTTTDAYEQIYTNAAGCDSLHTLNLTVNYSSSSTTSATACDSYVWASPLGDGATYTSSNTTATHTSTNAAGCVHTETLDLT
ncbi:MAG: hypothetical protein K9I70_08925, partial [Chitinophagaceae bacterium]|nr:hypothetical protein [Chitinophagaceae bacterium]